jgi:hypothetical protein
MAVNKYIIQLVVETGSGQAKVKGVSDAFEQLGQKVDATSTKLKNNSKAMQNTAGSAGIAGAATAEFGRLISDLPYGLQAVTNNISQLGSMFALLVSSAGNVRAAMNAMLLTLSGPAGVLIAFQAAVAALEYFSRGAKSAVDAIDEINKAQGKAASDLKAFRDMIQLQALSFEDATDAVERFNDEYEDLNLKLDKTNFLTRESKIALDGLIDSLEEAARAKAALALIEGAYQEKIEQEIHVQKLRNTEVNMFTNTAEYLKDVMAGFIIMPSLGRSLRLKGAEMDLERISNNVSDIIGMVGNEGLADKIFGPKKEGEDEDRKKKFFPFLSDKELTDLEEQYKDLDPTKFLNDSLFDEGEKLSRSFIEGLIYGQEEIEDPLLGYVNLRKLEIEEEIIAESDRQKELAEIKQAELEVFKEVELAKVDIIETAFRTIADISQSNRFIQAAALLGESAAGIAKVIINTKSANAALRLQQAAIATLNPAAAALIEAKIKANNVFAAADIAANIGATATALSRLKAPMATPSTPSIGSDGGVSIPVVAPGFNVVGAAGQNQLAAAIAGQFQQPVKAYVVSSDVTTAQELDRRIVQGASI